jgi:hypothetical protein
MPGSNFAGKVSTRAGVEAPENGTSAFGPNYLQVPPRGIQRGGAGVTMPGSFFIGRVSTGWGWLPPGNGTSGFGVLKLGLEGGCRREMVAQGDFVNFGQVRLWGIHEASWIALHKVSE